MVPQPAPTDPMFGGTAPDGQVYEARCAFDGNPLDTWDYLWRIFQDPPEGTPETPADLARRATDSMTLLGPDIHTSIRAGGMALVGLPVWLWTTADATRWGPNTATASVPGLSVNATARAHKIVWDMGDGHQVTCTSPGSAYDAADGGTVSPSCGYEYQRSSARMAGHTYQITATTTWDISWTGGGESGRLTRTRTSTDALRVGELQVLIR